MQNEGEMVAGEMGMTNQASDPQPSSETEAVSSNNLVENDNLKLAFALELVEKVEDPAVRDELRKAILELVATADEEKEDAIKEAAIDSLTGLIRNRDHFVKAVDEERRVQSKEGERVSMRGALIFIDINKFKTINEKYSHRAGDEIFRRIAEWAGQLRSQDISMRYGGDEFVIYMPATNPAMIGKVIMKRIMKFQAENPIVVQDRDDETKSIQLDIKFSIGVMPLPAAKNGDGSEIDYDQIIHEASLKMQTAKNLFKAHDQNVVAYLDKEGQEAIATEADLNHDQSSQEPVAEEID